MTNLLTFAGGEDIDFTPVGGPQISTNSSTFRSYARCSLQVLYSSATNYLSATTWSCSYGTGSEAFWMSAYLYLSQVTQPTVSNPLNCFLIRIFDNSDTPVPRLYIAPATTGTWNPTGPYAVYTFDGSNRVQIGSNFNMFALNTLSKIDITLQYSTTGFITVYVDGSEVYSYSGNITTGSDVALAGADYGNAMGDGGGHSTSYGTTSWSEVIVANADTRSMSLVTQAITGFAAGGESQWTGSYAPLANITTNPATGINTITANLVDDFSITPPPSGNFTVLAVQTVAYALTAAGSPQNIQLGLRLGSTDYFSPDLAVGDSFSRLAYEWGTNPNTSAAWTQADLTSLGMAIQSIA